MTAVVCVRAGLEKMRQAYNGAPDNPEVRGREESAPGCMPRPPGGAEGHIVGWLRRPHCKTLWGCGLSACSLGVLAVPPAHKTRAG